MIPPPTQLGTYRDAIILPQDTGVVESFRHAKNRLKELAKAEGIFVDEYLALSVMEWVVGGVLQEMPGLLPVVQTTVSLVFETFFT